MPNRLSDETSPYLLQHAENPVDWYPWGPAALKRAQEEDKPIFLSIGYAACHWCHVMAHESFEDPETARLLNEHFINIKVDREERPDLDAIYMQSVIAITGQGGWPLSVFLMPTGEPFYGGTYFPPSPRYGMPSFRDLLKEIIRLWNEDRGRLDRIGADLARQLQKTPALSGGEAELQPQGLEQATRTLFQAYDWRHGGWGRAPKFPQPAILRFLLLEYATRGDKLARDMALHALRAMARGGMYDLIGGGFHRYSVDDRWLVPHFEKMLYDNALLANAYLDGWLASGHAGLARVARQTLRFMVREMASPEGGFYSSFDADSEGQEGKYYLWTWQEVGEAIPDAGLRELAIKAYSFATQGNFQGRNIPTMASSLQELAGELGLEPRELEAKLEEARILLLRARRPRLPPATDDKIITAWNGFALSALARAARHMAWDEMRDFAQRSADFLLSNLIVDGQLKRAYRAGQARFTAYLEDHAALALGLIDLYQTDFNPRWLEAARARAHEILEHFSDPEGGFFDTRDDHESLLARPRTLQDSPTPSGNALAIALFQRLYMLDGDPMWREPAHGALRAFQRDASRHPTAFAAWLYEIRMALNPPTQLALVGEPAHPAFQALLAQANGLFLPQLVLAGADPGQPGQAGLLHGRDLLQGHPAAYLCRGFQCDLPTSDPEVLAEQLASLLPETASPAGQQGAPS